MKFKILLAEDDEDDQMLFSEYLDNYPGVEIVPPVENGEQVLSYLTSLKDDELPHAIILDQNMPLRSGLQTLQLLKSSSKFSPIKVMIYSTYVDDQLVESSKSSGAILAITKPSTEEGYIAMMDKLVGYL